MRLFDALVRSIMGYGAEVWGWKEWKEVERIQDKYQWKEYRIYQMGSETRKDDTWTHTTRRDKETQNCDDHREMCNKVRKEISRGGRRVNRERMLGYH